MARAKNSGELCMAHVENLYNIPCIPLVQYAVFKVIWDS